MSIKKIKLLAKHQNFQINYVLLCTKWRQ